MVCSDVRFVVQPVRNDLLPDAGLASIEKMKEGDILTCLVTATARKLVRRRPWNLQAPFNLFVV